MDASRRGNATTFVIYLHCAGTALRAVDVVADPRLASLAVEDLCWVLTREAWFQREPRPWQRRRLRVWRADGAWLGGRRAQLREFARGCGVAVSPDA